MVSLTWNRNNDIEIETDESRDIKMHTSLDSVLDAYNDRTDAQ
jgi:hypothetical protein